MRMLALLIVAALAVPAEAQRADLSTARERLEVLQAFVPDWAAFLSRVAVADSATRRRLVDSLAIQLRATPRQHARVLGARACPMPVVRPRSMIRRVIPTVPAASVPYTPVQPPGCVNPLDLRP